MRFTPRSLHDAAIGLHPIDLAIAARHGGTPPGAVDLERSHADSCWSSTSGTSAETVDAEAFFAKHGDWYSPEVFYGQLPSTLGNPQSVSLP